MSKLNEDMNEIAKNKRREKRKEILNDIVDGVVDKIEAQKEAIRERRRNREDRIYEAKKIKKYEQDFKEKVELAVEKIMEIYGNMDSDYIKNDDVEILKNNRGDIIGFVNGLAFASDKKRNLIFYDEPIEHRLGYYDPYDGFVEEDVYFDHPTITVKLGKLKNYRINKVEYLKDLGSTDISYKRIVSNLDYERKQRQSVKK